MLGLKVILTFAIGHSRHPTDFVTKIMQENIPIFSIWTFKSFLKLGEFKIPDKLLGSLKFKCKNIFSFE
ncbi:hypothetical protein PM10SUCC1_31640 [Propionigenium maris DSM 9537]|uniref:Uncharacterized protein n=1 Tax=Propionigenium maris DSM 9537 TaxID=1123000 RepID=A0A9W6LPZ8_9FUSO|nr:hypothetical protein PM10SUCC1_31640 [Propionigenium maris DSM 9537]